MVLDIENRAWGRDGSDGKYIVSTDPELVQVDEVNRMFGSDVMWWAQGLPREELAKALRNSLCFGLPRFLEDTPVNAMIDDRQSLKQVGFARLVTDGVTFAWLTDVYVVAEHQGRGLARFLMESIKDVISEWRYLRRFMLLASDSMDLYRKTLGVKDWRELGTDAVGVGVLEGPSGQRPSH
ncbi:hypothetical protein Micbo1qcDRAFT_207260 [Microdochium bolleyi]|uniref:N-acetyltransferase domain-containing protein n=1 Tax=Microdochium bolleyi TaxID=196109 RepID=A0A136IU13_9PEZI|nr:hypothetical protein Micbo1qcDRAFT_207260 [Microdochium bolleyi]